jgi:membrane-associated phospholipid phosphatase
MATYLLYPAAPPWYVTDYGFGPIPEGVVAGTASAARFYALTGLVYFEHFYGHGTDVFGAVLSLYAAFSLVVFLTARGMGFAWSAWTMGFALLVGFSAIYLQDHYLIDVLVGYAYVGMAAGVSYGWRDGGKGREALTGSGEGDEKMNGWS